MLDPLIVSFYFNKLKRDWHLGTKALGYKIWRATKGYTLSKLYLRAANFTGKRCRTVGCPRIVNWGELIIGDDFNFVSYPVTSELVVETKAKLHIGNECSFNYGVSIAATKSITIGDRVRMGPYVMVVDSAFHDKYERKKRPPSRPIVIHDDVWIGAKATIMPGVTLGQGAIVGTNSVVTKDVPPFTVVGGIPAKTIEILDPLTRREKTQ